MDEFFCHADSAGFDLISAEFFRDAARLRPKFGAAFRRFGAAALFCSDFPAMGFSLSPFDLAVAPVPFIA